MGQPGEMVRDESDLRLSGHFVHLCSPLLAPFLFGHAFLSEAKCGDPQNFTADTICFIPWLQQTLKGQVEKPLELCPPPENSKPRGTALYPAESWGPAFHTH